MPKKAFSFVVRALLIVVVAPPARYGARFRPTSQALFAETSPQFFCHAGGKPLDVNRLIACDMRYLSG